MKIISKISKKIKRKIRRIRNLKTAYVYSPTNDGWEKYPHSILGSVHDGTFFDPYVMKYKDKFLLYVSFRNENSIVRYESYNGIDWNNCNTVLQPDYTSKWERIVNRASIINLNGKWFMWYTGQTETTSCIGLALSKDGIHFKRYTSNPVIIPDRTYEKTSVMNPCVIWDGEEKIFKMWYSAGENYEPDVICYALSKDGFNWKKSKDNPILEKGYSEYDKYKVGGCDVHKINNSLYLMYYIGYQNIDTARICLTKSSDGIHNWKRYSQNPIISPSKAKWDAHAVYKPTVCLDKNFLYMWYNGRKGCREYIGFAQREINRNVK